MTAADHERADFQQASFKLEVPSLDGFEHDAKHLVQGCSDTDGSEQCM